MLGNTLTGEFSRANTLRLRWPYVRRVLDAALTQENWPANQRETFLAGLEEKYKSPFPPVGEETLAGGLSNTIAGRICNQFNLKGGGYTVDGACASSLLAAANACSALVASDLDVAVAGGVDLSLDPFEIVGFAKTGALAPDEMRVFDRRAAGFWPGEGCGMVVLMRHEDALAQCRRVYAVIRGWGISSDGSGGMTRPESDGQLEALRRAYRRAGFGIETVAYCEGHGTGTAVGDTTELEVLSRARRETKKPFPPAAVGSIKANIGHTKAAAGIAGLIKATMAVHTQVLPPTTDCEQPHAQLTGPAPALRVLPEAEIWPAYCPLRASVSAMGFGGINAHVVLESVVGERREKFSVHEGALARSHQDAELFLFTAPSPEALAGQIGKLIRWPPAFPAPKWPIWPRSWKKIPAGENAARAWSRPNRRRWRKKCNSSNRACWRAWRRGWIFPKIPFSVSATPRRESGFSFPDRVRPRNSTAASGGGGLIPSANCTRAPSCRRTANWFRPA